jgi:hypothetical protein
MPFLEAERRNSKTFRESVKKSCKGWNKGKGGPLFYTLTSCKFWNSLPKDMTLFSDSIELDGFVRLSDFDFKEPLYDYLEIHDL